MFRKAHPGELLRRPAERESDASSRAGRHFSRSARFRNGIALAVTSLLGLLLCPAFLYAQSASPTQADVITALRRGDTQGALSLAQTALKQSPRDCALLSLQGVALSAIPDAERALHSFNNALTSCPRYLPALEGAAQIQFAQHRAETIPLLERVLAVQPANITANAMLATMLRETGKCKEALPHYAASQALFANRPDLVQGYGTCLANTGDLSSALDTYQHLLATNPNDSIRYDVALLQWKTHAAADALTTLDSMLTGAHDVPALALASKIHEEQGDTPKAVSLLREAILQSPDDVENYLDFAAIAFAHTSFQVGVDMLNAGLKRLPDSPPLLVARGVLEVQLSQPEAAIADFEAAHKRDPKLSFAMDAIGILHSQQHLSTDSLALFESQAKLHPDDPLLQYLLAEQLAEDGARSDPAQLEKAIAAGKRAVALDPTYRAAHDLLAVLYVRGNQPKLAIEQSEAALALDPNDQEALYQEILSRRRLGDTAEVKALTARLEDARRTNAEKQDQSGRYSLQEEPRR